MTAPAPAGRRKARDTDLAPIVALVAAVLVLAAASLSFAWFGRHA